MTNQWENRRQPREQAWFEMTTPTFPIFPRRDRSAPAGSPGDPEPDQQLRSIRLARTMPAQNDFSLQLIVNSAIHVVPGSSAVIYTYDQASGAFEKESRVSAAPEEQYHLSAVDHPDDAPRPDGIGMRTIQRRQRSLSYEEPDLDVHPYHASLGVKAVACFPLIVARPGGGYSVHLSARGAPVHPARTTDAQ